MSCRETGPAFLWDINQFLSASEAQLAPEQTAPLESDVGIDPLALWTNVSFSFDDDPGQALVTGEDPGESPPAPLSDSSKSTFSMAPELLKPALTSANNKRALLTADLEPSPMGPALWKQALASLDDGKPAPTQPSALSSSTAPYDTLSRRQALLSALGNPLALVQNRKALDSAGHSNTASQDPVTAMSPAGVLPADISTAAVPTTSGSTAEQQMADLPAPVSPDGTTSEHQEQLNTRPLEHRSPGLLVGTPSKAPDVAISSSLKRTHEPDDGAEGNGKLTSIDDEKRRRNMLASARFRQRKKQRIDALAKEQASLQARIQQLQESNTRLRQENSELRGRFPHGPPELAAGLASL